MRRVAPTLLIVLCLLMAGCGPQPASTYTVTGRITKADNPGQGLEGVTIAFSGGYGITTTNANGGWSKSGLAGTVTVTPAKEGWTFDPVGRQVTRGTSDANFVATHVPIPIEFEDPNLEAAVRATIGKPTGQLMDTDVARIVTLNAGSRSISRPRGIEHLVSLRVLLLYDNQISDISPLEGLTNIEWLNLHDNQVSDISPLAGLTSVSTLYLSNNQISDISPLEGLTSVSTLDLDYNQISDTSPLAELTNVSILGLLNNQVSDISPLAGLTSVSTLYLSNNQISDISPLEGLTNTEELLLNNNQVFDISPLEGLTNLSILSLQNNLISDISPLVANLGLGNWDSVWLQYNQLDLSPGSDDMQNINALIARGVTVYYDPQGPAPSSAIH